MIPLFRFSMGSARETYHTGAQGRSIQVETQTSENRGNNGRRTTRTIRQSSENVDWIVVDMGSAKPEPSRHRRGRRPCAMIRRSPMPTRSASSIVADPRNTSHSWWPVTMMLACSLLSYMDRQILAVLSPIILADLKLNAEKYAEIISSFSVAYML